MSAKCDNISLMQGAVEAIHLSVTVAEVINIVFSTEATYLFYTMSNKEEK